MNNLLAKAAFNHIDEYFPGLFVYDQGGLYFTDREISSEPVHHQNTLFVGEDIITISLVGKGFSLTLFPEPVIKGNNFEMDYDFKLSTKACMSLYEHDIYICYDGGLSIINGKGDYICVGYDRVSIERQWTIKNIINEGQLNFGKDGR